MNILYEDNHLIALNKSVSDLVQGDKTGDKSLDVKTKEYLKNLYKKPGNVFLGVIHRLDRPVSGVVVFARTSKALSRMNKLFQEKKVQKKYWAIVSDKPPIEEERLDHFLVRKPNLNKSFAYSTAKKGSKEASLSYRLMGRTKNYFFLEIDLHTGRHHQIRCQLAKIGCPIKGDLKYGSGRSNPGGGISLHAREIEFIHPVLKEELKIIADPPKDVLWNEFLEMAGNQ
ncbi:MAG: RluA family pseudouridine synthase [Bacteroidota bacterium]|nr:RluA family pseudouridine synthase [Bacteroidota bacterium]